MLPLLGGGVSAINSGAARVKAIGIVAAMPVTASAWRCEDKGKVAGPLRCAPIGQQWSAVDEVSLMAAR